MAFSITDEDKGYAALLRRMLKNKKPASLSVGIHADEGAEPYKGKKDGGSGELTIAQLGEIHEFGLGVPQRSFIGDWFDESKAEKLTQIRNVAKAFANGEIESLEDGFEQLGLLYVGQIQQRIAEGIDPPLADITIARKGSSTPLIDTGQLRSSITYEVHKGGAKKSGGKKGGRG